MKKLIAAASKRAPVVFQLAGSALTAGGLYQLRSWLGLAVGGVLLGSFGVAAEKSQGGA